jgi:SAM-dependent methyltransferase
MTGFHYSIRRRYLDRDLEVVVPQMRGRVLEIGAGHAGRRGRFQPPTAGVTRWVHVDHDRARRPDVAADVVDLPFAGDAFDAIVCLEVLEYVWQPARALSEIARVVKPGGAVILATPFLHRADAPTDSWRFTEPALRRLFRAAGLQVETCTAQGGPLAVVVNILRYVMRTRTSATARVVAVLLSPFFELALRIDASMATADASQGFTTGFLILARRTGPAA